MRKHKDLVKLGERVKELRLSQGLSQEELAFKCGLHRTYIGMVERGERNLNYLTLLKVAKGLGVSVRDLV